MPNKRVFPGRSRALLITALVSLTLCTGSRAWAQAENAEVETVTQLNRKALDKYKAGDYDEARKLLKQALDLCSSAELDKHPIRARTHVHMGVVILVGFNQKPLALKQFRKALQIQPEIRITKMLSSPEVEEAFTEAAASKDDTDAEPAAPAVDTPASEPTAPAVTQRPARKPAAKPVKKVAEEEEEEEEEEDEGTASKTVFIGLGAGAGYGVMSGSTATAPTVDINTGSGTAGLFHGMLEVGLYARPDIIISLAGRLQYMGAGTDMTNPAYSTGLAPGTPISKPQTIAFAGLLRLNMLFGKQGFRPYLGFAVGGGQIAHQFTYNYPRADGSVINNRKDNVMAGFIMLGPSAGFFIDLGASVHLILGIQTELALPNFSINIDGHGGLGFSF